MIVKSFTKAIKGISLITAGVFSFSIAANAQVATLTNDGAMFYINTGGVVFVDGHVDNQAGILVNLGTMEIEGNIVNDAQLGGNGSPLPGNHGLFQVEGDWRNNNIFFAGTGRVLLDGPVQGITGIAPSYFYDLELAGTDRKEIQFTDQFVTNTLILNDRELWTDQYTMHVENTNAGAITRTTGFVSSLEAGSLSRKTLNAVDYLFPVGSTQNNPRYRPAKIRPTTSFPNTFTVRLVNANPITDDIVDPTDYAKDALLHDTDICYVNDNYWYKINHPVGTDNADLSLSYDAVPVPYDQGAYNAIAQWDSITDNRWENLGFPNSNSLTTDPNDSPTLTFVRRNAVNINNSLPEPYTLAYLIPPAPVQFGESVICADVQTTYSIIPNTNGTYEFFVDSTEGTIISTTATSATVIWNDVPFGTINVIETIDNQNGYVACPSLVGSFLVDILSLPAAIFGTTYEYPNPNPNGTYGYNNPDDVFINDLISFHDSSTNTVSWWWDFNDGVNSVNQNPYHTYGDLGTFNVMMVATSPDGCLDTAYKTINVVEGLIVPNVFTPNGDGYNDVFKIRNSAVSEFTFRVFNRWGTQIYETTAPEIAWDGKTTAGSAAPAGTYFYTLDAKLESGNDIAIFQDKETLEKGHITLIR
jgi:gliding motility-associated-like protein